MPERKRRRRRLLGPGIAIASVALAISPLPALAEGEARSPTEDITTAVYFERQIAPLLATYCYDCHGYGGDDGGVALDTPDDLVARLSDRDKWERAYRNVRAQLMPPRDADQPPFEERQTLLRWIERAVFNVDANRPDPGRLPPRRLNRVQYRYTIKDLFGVDYDTAEHFPPDDTGYGFDTVGEVLSLSPLLVEKYFLAAEQVARQATPVDGPEIPVRRLAGRELISEDGQARASWASFEKPVVLRKGFYVTHPGRRHVRVDMHVAGSMEATTNSARLRLLIDGESVAGQALGWDYRNSIPLSAEVQLSRGSHEIALELTPESPPAEGEHPLRLAVRFIQLRGPLDGSRREYGWRYRRWFSPQPAPPDREGRREYARGVLRPLAERAYRRPVDEATIDRLVDLALTVDARPNTRFEEGVAQALAAVLASPRFLLRVDQPDPEESPDTEFARVDQHSLATRLSYFLWCSTPDERLLTLANEGKLRAQLHDEVERMLDDSRSGRMVEEFVGQWLRTRDTLAVHLDPARVLGGSRKKANERFTGTVRHAMKRETELLFEHVLRENRDATEMLTANYTFVNEPLAKLYGLAGVKGRRFRRVPLPAASHRRGVLTHGSLLVVTSNPTRTSPVKRGMFVLDNLLGAPPPPPPPDVPELDEAAEHLGAGATTRELMELHRADPTCAACHERMDPLGLALENYNALGMYRDQEQGQPIDASGRLTTGERFASAVELAGVLATQRRKDYLRCLTEKMFTFAVGRGVAYYDSAEINRIAAELASDHGRIRTLVHAIVDAAAFQKMRRQPPADRHSANPTNQAAKR